MKRILYLLLAAAVVAAGVGYYLWHKPHENMEKAKAEMTCQSPEIFHEFEADEAAANAKYLNKTIAVCGNVKEVSKGENGTMRVSLDCGGDGMFGIACELDPLSKHPRTDFPVGELVTFKGICTGYNMDVQLTRCVEVGK